MAASHLEEPATRGHWVMARDVCGCLLGDSWHQGSGSREAAHTLSPRPQDISPRGRSAPNAISVKAEKPLKEPSGDEGLVINAEGSGA